MINNKQTYSNDDGAHLVLLLLTIHALRASIENATATWKPRPQNIPKALFAESIHVKWEKGCEMKEWGMGVKENFSL